MIDKTYAYRPGRNETWEVYGTLEDGIEDWVADVSTETVAQALITVLCSTPPCINGMSVQPTSFSPIENAMSVKSGTDKYQSLIQQIIDESYAGKITLSKKLDKVRINLAVLTRQEYSVIVDIPTEFKLGDRMRLVDMVYDATNGTEFWDDNEYWEKGNCWHEDIEVE